MNWTPVLDRYLTEMVSRRYSPCTVALTGRWLRLLAQHCEVLNVATVAATTREHLALFHQGLMWHTDAVTGRRYAPRTVDQGLRVVRSFFRWAMTAQLVLVDPTRHWTLPRVNTLPAPVLSLDDVARLLDVPSPTTASGLRDRAILEMFYSTGVRRAECGHLDLHDVELATQTLWVRSGKGAKDRCLPMGSTLTAALSEYLSHGRPHLVHTPHEPALFLDRYGQRLSDQRYNQMVRQMGREVGLQVTPHQLRHACATHLLEGGADLLHVQRLLGHEYLASTELYTHLSPLDVKRMHRRAHPRARRRPPQD
jgi:integrase/recombinase XerD